MLAFLGIATVVIVVPGQDTALTVRNTLLGGRAAGCATALGVASGLAVWTAATSVGLGALLVASERAFLVLRLVGAAYLVYLGLHALWAAARRRPAPARSGRGAERPRVAYRQGLLSNLGNPKILAFFTSLLPQFSSSGPGLLAHGLVFCALTAAWLVLYAAVVAHTRRVFDRAAVRRLVDSVTGLVLVAFGLRLATERG